MSGHSTRYMTHFSLLRVSVQDLFSPIWRARFLLISAIRRYLKPQDAATSIQKPPIVGSITYQTFTFITVNMTCAGRVVRWHERSYIRLTSRSWIYGFMLDKNTISVLIFIKSGIVERYLGQGRVPGDNERHSKDQP